MEGDEREEGDPPRVSRSTAKRARKVSLGDNAEASEVGISNDFLQKAKIIQENLRIYLTKADKSIKNKDQNHINGKIQWFIDAIESLEERTKQYKDKSEGLSLLVHKAVQETLTSPSVHSMITSIVIEKTVPKVIESLSGTTMKSNGPLAIPGKSNEKSSATNVTPPEPLPAAVPFTVVKSKRNRKKTKKSTGRHIFSPDRGGTFVILRRNQGYPPRTPFLPALSSMGGCELSASCSDLCFF
ncbi:unnamed protein product [Nezara viridula]|uniref:Uncharacterized protein n=1 Tax=Nezara viridula TaxID=85310 RepID=A0A9P0HJD0_NEZVI|nr:unnamed protein product [Nezara viridula]